MFAAVVSHAFSKGEEIEIDIDIPAPRRVNANGEECCVYWCGPDTYPLYRPIASGEVCEEFVQDIIKKKNGEPKAIINCFLANQLNGPCPS